MASPSPTPSSSSSSKCSFVSYSDGDALTEPIVPIPPHISNADKLAGLLPSLTDRPPDEMSFDELKQCFEATKKRLEKTETSMDKYKVMVHKNQDQSRALASELKEQLGLTSGMFQSAAPHLQTTCKTLRQQRDRLVDEICLLSQSHKAKGATCNADQLETTFNIQHQSIQQEIQAARDLLDQLDQRRDAILEEMVLLNTKNAELNTMNNDLSRHIAQRELETKTLMAATQFLQPSSSSETTASSSTYPPPTRPLPNPSASSSTNSSTSTTYRKPTKKQQKQAKKRQQDQEDQDQPTSASSETRIFPFSRHKNVFASRGLHKKKSSESESTHLTMSKSSERPPSPSSISSVSSRTPTDPPPPPLEDRGLYKRRQSLAEIISPNGLHQFIETKFLRPTRCEWCQEKMWRSHELKCQACSLVCHAKCATFMKDPCKNAPTSQTKLPPSVTRPKQSQRTKFGRDLVVQAQDERQLIPLVVQCCVEAVDYRGLDFEGIYRKSGGAGQMRLIQQSLEAEEEARPDLCDSTQYPDICAITSILKQYFRDLPNPLFPYECYDRLMDSVDCPDLGSRLAKMNQVFRTIPKENFHTIHYLMRHLDRVQQHSQTNLMVTKNLALVFGPTLIRNRDEKDDITETSQKIHVIDFILHHINELFETSPPTSP